MKRGKYSILIWDGGFMEVEGWILNENFACRKEGNFWMVTHLPTGCSIFSQHARRECIEKVKLISGLTDWKEIKSTGDLGNKALSELKEILRRK